MSLGIRLNDGNPVGLHERRAPMGVSTCLEKYRREASGRRLQGRFFPAQ